MAVPKLVDDASKPNATADALYAPPIALVSPPPPPPLFHLGYRSRDLTGEEQFRVAVQVACEVLSAATVRRVSSTSLSDASTMYAREPAKLAIPPYRYEELGRLFNSENFPLRIALALSQYRSQLAPVSCLGVTTKVSAVPAEKVLDLLMAEGDATLGRIHEFEAEAALVPPQEITEMVQWIGTEISDWIAADAPKVDPNLHLVGFTLVMEVLLSTHLQGYVDDAADAAEFALWGEIVDEIRDGVLMFAVDRLRKVFAKSGSNKFYLGLFSVGDLQDKFGRLSKMLKAGELPEYGWRLEHLQQFHLLLREMSNSIDGRKALPMFSREMSAVVPVMPSGDWAYSPVTLRGAITVVVPIDDENACVHQRSTTSLHAMTLKVCRIDNAHPSGVIYKRGALTETKVISLAHVTGFGVTDSRHVMCHRGFDAFSPPELDDAVAVDCREIDSRFKALIVHEWNTAPDVFGLLGHNDECLIIWGAPPTYCLPVNCFSDDMLPLGGAIVRVDEVRDRLMSFGISYPGDLIGIRITPPPLISEEADTAGEGLVAVAEAEASVSVLESVVAPSVELDPAKKLARMVRSVGGFLKWEVLKRALERPALNCWYDRKRGHGDHSMMFRETRAGKQSYTIAPNWEDGTIHITPNVIGKVLEGLEIPVGEFVSALEGVRPFKHWRRR